MISHLLTGRVRLAVLTAVIWAAPAGAGESAGSWKCLPGEAPVKLNGFLDDTDLSGIAMTGSFVLVASDENAGIQLGTINAAGSAIQFTSQIPLAPSKKKKDGGGEIDMEGVCLAGPEKVFYVTGSHGVGKKRGDFQPLRFGIYRLPCDPEKGTILTAEISRSSLLPWLENSREFGTSIRRPLQQNGFNIEGIAHASGYLYFGVRAPSLDGRAFIIEVRADELFHQQGAGITPRVHPVPLGADTGIREIAAVAGGFLILSGSAAADGSGRDDSAFTLSFVPSAGPGQLGQPVRIADVTAPGGKAEGLLVLEDSAQRIRILVLHDGLAQGGAAAYTLQRPAGDSAGSRP